VCWSGPVCQSLGTCPGPAGGAMPCYWNGLSYQCACAVRDCPANAAGTPCQPAQGRVCRVGGDGGEHHCFCAEGNAWTCWP
jgi:hypothetical protein